MMTGGGGGGVHMYIMFMYTLCSSLRGPGFYSFVNFLSLLKQGEVNGIRVRLDRLQALISTSCVENLECTQLDSSLEQKLL